LDRQFEKEPFFFAPLAAKNSLLMLFFRGNHRDFPAITGWTYTVNGYKFF
jgi:hypothetical protein